MALLVRSSCYLITSLPLSRTFLAVEIFSKLAGHQNMSATYQQLLNQWATLAQPFQREQMN